MKKEKQNSFPSLQFEYHDSKSQPETCFPVSLNHMLSKLQYNYYVLLKTGKSLDKSGRSEIHYADEKGYRVIFKIRRYMYN